MTISTQNIGTDFLNAAVNATGQIDLFDHYAGNITSGDPLTIDLPVDHAMALQKITDHQMNSNQAIFAYLFLTRYDPSTMYMRITQDDIRHALQKLGRKPPKNLPDLTYRLREQGLPTLITDTAPTGQVWTLEPMGGAVYCLSLDKDYRIEPDMGAEKVHLQDASRDLAAAFELSSKAKLELQFTANKLLDRFLNTETTFVGKPPSGYTKKAGLIEFDSIYAARSDGGDTRSITVYLSPRMPSISENRANGMLKYSALTYPHMETSAVVVLPIEDGTLAFLEIEKGPVGARVAREVHYELI